MKDFIIPDRDFGTPAAKSEKMVTLTIDGFEVTVPEGTSDHARGDAEAGIQVPKLCATDMSMPSAPAGSAWSRSRAATARRPPAPRRSRPAWVHTQTAKLKHLPQGRDGALHLRPPAGLPDLRRQWRLRIAGHGRRRGPARCAL
jgi:formate dehydrogenase major subunit